MPACSGGGNKLVQHENAEFCQLFRKAWHRFECAMHIIALIPNHVAMVML